MKKVLDFYEKIIGWLEIALNLLIVGVIGLQIITRFFFNLPLKFPEEVSAFALIAMVFVGVSVVERHRTSAGRVFAGSSADKREKSHEYC